MSVVLNFDPHPISWRTETLYCDFLLVWYLLKIVYTYSINENYNTIHNNTFWYEFNEYNNCLRFILCLSSFCFVSLLFPVLFLSFLAFSSFLLYGKNLLVNFLVFSKYLFLTGNFLFQPFMWSSDRRHMDFCSSYICVFFATLAGPKKWSLKSVDSISCLFPIRKVENDCYWRSGYFWKLISIYSSNKLSQKQFQRY